MAVDTRGDEGDRAGAVQAEEGSGAKGGGAEWSVFFLFSSSLSPRLLLWVHDKDRCRTFDNDAWHAATTRRNLQTFR